MACPTWRSSEGREASPSPAVRQGRAGRSRPGAVHGCTDVTGFGLAGHACEMAAASGVAFEIDVAALPLLPGARELALGNKTGGLVNNRGHFGAAVDEGAVPADLLALAFDPQTSGGLLASVDPDAAEGVLGALAASGVHAAQVGLVVPATSPTRVFLR